LVRGVFYHSGDPLWYDNTVPLLKTISLDLALLAINGNDALRGVAGNLNGKRSGCIGESHRSETASFLVIMICLHSTPPIQKNLPLKLKKQDSLIAF
jgi:hypothetical protein